MLCYFRDIITAYGILRSDYSDIYYMMLPIAMPRHRAAEYCSQQFSRRDSFLLVFQKRYAARAGVARARHRLLSGVTLLRLRTHQPPCNVQPTPTVFIETCHAYTILLGIGFPSL